MRVSVAAETLMGIHKRVIVSPAVYPRFLEIAELARSLCHSWATCIFHPWIYGQLPLTVTDRHYSTNSPTWLPERSSVNNWGLGCRLQVGISSSLKSTGLYNTESFLSLCYTVIAHCAFVWGLRLSKLNYYITQFLWLWTSVTAGTGWFGAKRCKGGPPDFSRPVTVSTIL